MYFQILLSSVMVAERQHFGKELLPLLTVCSLFVICPFVILFISQFGFEDRILVLTVPFEPRYEKTGLRGFRPVRTLTGLCSHRRWLEA